MPTENRSHKNFLNNFDVKKIMKVIPMKRIVILMIQDLTLKKNLDKEHKYKEYDECKEYSSMVAKTNESKRRKSRLR